MALDCCVFICQLLLATECCASLTMDRQHVWTDVARLLRWTDGMSGQAGVNQSRTVITPATLYMFALYVSLAFHELFQIVTYFAQNGMVSHK
jgi:hypothetical protein